MDKTENHPIKSIIGLEIKQLRNSLNLTQVEFGEKLNLDAAYISKIERGIKPISSIQLFTVLSKCNQNDAIEFVVKIINKVNSRNI